MYIKQLTLVEKGKEENNMYIKQLTLVEKGKEEKKEKGHEM